MLNSLKRNIHFKNKHFYSRNVNKEKLIYVPDEILDINKAKKVYENIKDWEDLIDNDVILKAVKDLDIKSQRILWMLIVNRATQKEVSSVLNISQQSISKEKKRILNKLRRKINYEE
ncbi:sigma factor-like helix-turn-helix DNA-binding protein [Companilactobacillus nantensis]|nr:sigma factor-like helix-turn-helix DNA-binding protein [Companilactobacillus nantensis]